MDKSLEAVKRHMQGKKFVRGKGGAELGRRLGGGTCRSRSLSGGHVGGREGNLGGGVADCRWGCRPQGG